MRRMIKVFALPLMAVALCSVPAIAQEHRDNDTYQHHDEWKKGAQISHDDWNRGDKVDYKDKHLRKPPEGHEWRRIDGNYVMANQDGKIASVVRPAPRNHQRSPEQHPQ